MASGVYNGGKAGTADGSINLGADDMRVLLVNASYTPNPDHKFVSSITNELSGTGYSRKALTTETVTQDDTNDRAAFSADNLTWTGANFGTPRYAIVYKFNASDASARLFCWIDLGGTTVTNGGDYTIKFNNGSTSGDLARLS